MIRNFFKIAWRNMIGNKTDSLINLFGLSIGMAACLLILEFVSYELSFDRFNSHAADIYRVVNDRYQKGVRVQHGTITYSAVGPAMKTDFPEVLETTRMEPMGQTILIEGDKKVQANEAVAADDHFLTMFDYPLLAGNSTSALRQPGSVVLAESLAKKLFGEKAANPSALLGTTLRLDTDSALYKITGIARDFPANSHLQYDMILSYVSLYSGNMNWKEAEYDFTDSDFWHYIRLKPGTDYKKLEARFPAFSRKYFQGDKVSGSDEKFSLQPLLDAHLKSDYEYEIGQTGSSTAVWGMLIIALLTIIIAWVNYINLTTARSMNRAKEVGIRKVSGATRTQLVRQFLTESLLMNVLALILAIVIVISVQKAFNHLVERELSLSWLFSENISDLHIKGLVFAGMVAGILISGFYPAFVLSSFKPILVLKGKFSQGTRGILLRKMLVTAQFAATIALIVGSLIVYRQIRFVNRQDLGMNLSHVLIVKPPVQSRWDSSFIPHMESLKNELRSIPGVSMASTGARVAGREFARTFNVRRADKPEVSKITLRRTGGDKDLLPLYEIPITAGRPLDANDYHYKFDDINNIMLSEQAVKALNFSSDRDAIGKKINFWGRDWTVVGIFKDFHQKSLHYALEPLMFMPIYGTDHPISVRLKSADLSATIEAIHKKYDQFFPGNIFDYFFIEDSFNEQYKSDLLFGKVFALFSGFAIFIACLGLLGLSLFTTAQRTKEIGVRKVLGASASNIVLLLSKDFMLLIAFSFLIATPLAWYVMNNWLDGFAYRIPISWWVFPLAGFLALFIALSTVGLQTLKAAGMNPAKSLRTE